MAKILKAAKKVFGEDIDEKWIEDNIDNFKKLAKGGDEAQEAFDELSKTKADQVFEKLNEAFAGTNVNLDILRANWDSFNGS